MKTLIFISAILLGHFSFGQNQNGGVEENYGVSLKKGDSTDLSTITIFRFDSSDVATFPASYALKVFGRSDQYKNVQFITADTVLVKKALTQLSRQYCNALFEIPKKNLETDFRNSQRRRFAKRPKEN